jgi:TonB family protein
MLIRAIRNRSPRFLICGLLAFFAIPTASSPQSNDKGLAPAVAAALTKAKVKSVVVFDFIGPAERLNQLGQDLADRLSLSLENSSTKLHIIDSATIRSVIEKNRVTPDVIREPEIAWWLARQLHADALIVGRLSTSNQLDITVGLAKVHDGKEFEGFSMSMPLTAEMQKRLNTSLTEDYAGEFAKLGVNVSSMPSCISCPHPKYPEAGLASKKQATVVLAVLIGEDGLAQKIAVTGPGPYGFTQKAIEAVQSWKFKPANGLDGKPIGIWAPIEARFRLY